MNDGPEVLGPNDSPDGHPISAVAHYKNDLALLNYLLQDLRVLIRRYAKGEIALAAQQVLHWDVHGLGRRTVVCDPERLKQSREVQIVGFFGDRRPKADDETIDASEFDLIDEFVNYPGILSYSSIELVDHYWANLVVHAEPDDREAWRASEVHKDAVDRVAPAAYHGVRIHNGRIRGEGIPGSKTVLIEDTKYWDYDVSPTWHGIRYLPGGEHENLSGPIDPAVIDQQL